MSSTAFDDQFAPEPTEQPPSGQSAAPADAIAEAIDILTQSADDLRECHTLSTAPDDWSGELEAKAEYDRILRCVAALRCQPAAATTAPSDEHVSVVGMPEFDALLDHIYEHGTTSEGVRSRADALARALLARYGQAPAASAELWPVEEQPDGTILPVDPAEMSPKQPAPTASAEPVLRIYAEGSMRSVTEWLDGARDLPDGDHTLYAAPVAAQAPQDKQGDAGRLLRLMRYIGSAQVKRLRAQLGDVPTLGEIRRAVDSLPEGGPPVFNYQLTAQTPAVPEGWRLVPDTPTPEWVEAAALGVRIGTIAHTIADVLAAAPTPPASAAPAAAGDALREAVKTAYGYLWHVNNEPGTPNQYAPERAAYEARKVLREHLTKDERGEGINAARAALSGEGK